MKLLPQEIKQTSPLNELKTAQIGFPQKASHSYMANKLTTASVEGKKIFTVPSLSEDVLELQLRFSS